MKRKNHLPYVFLLTVFLSFSLFLGAMTPYEVVMVRGTVTYKGTSLQKGTRIEAPDLRNQELLSGEMDHFIFSGVTDEVHLLDRELRKVVVISARLRQPGRDLMLATRSLKTLGSDFEFRRAFTPDPGVIVLVREDTLLCKGLEQYNFSGDRQLAIRYVAGDVPITRIIGRNDTLFLTRGSWFAPAPDESGKPLNSFGISDIQLLIISNTPGKEKELPCSLPPFSLIFLDDIIRWLAEAPGSAPDKEDIYRFILPSFVKERQIQREIALYSPEEAQQWLRERISCVMTEISGK